MTVIVPSRVCQKSVFFLPIHASRHLARGRLALLLLVGPPLQDLVAQVAHRIDDALLGDRRFLDVAPRVLNDV